MCKTRSTESDLAYEHFYLVLPFIVEGLEIGYFEKTFIESWNYKNKTGSNVVFKNAFISLQCIISFIGLYKLLHPLGGIANRLQERGVDITEAYDEVSRVIKDTKSARKNIDKRLSFVFEQAERVAAKVVVQPSMTRIAKKQFNSDNIEGDSPEICYRRVFAITFIDTLISELGLRFTKLSHSVSRLLYLIPTVITKVLLDKDVYQQIIEMFGKDPSNQDVVEIKLSSWKRE